MSEDEWFRFLSGGLIGFQLGLLFMRRRMPRRMADPANDPRKPK